MQSYEKNWYDFIDSDKFLEKFIIDHQTMTYTVWKKTIDNLCILSSFIYAHSAAYRHLDPVYKQWLPYIEICFLIDFCIHFVLSFPDPKD